MVGSGGVAATGFDFVLSSLRLRLRRGVGRFCSLLSSGGCSVRARAYM